MSLALIFYGVFFFRKIRKKHRPLYKVGHFWINSGMLFYLGASLWIFALTSDEFMLKVGVETSQLIWSFYDINNVVKNILVAVGIYYSSKSIATEKSAVTEKAELV
jgi:hypothetical protein